MLRSLRLDGIEREWWESRYDHEMMLQRREVYWIAPRMHHRTKVENITNKAFILEHPMHQWLTI